MNTVVRYSSVGDIVLAASVTAGLAPVTFRTLPKYFELVRRFPGVVGTLGPDDAPVGGPVIDLHHNLRSMRLRANARVARYDLARRMRVWFKTEPAPSVLSRYAVAAGSPTALPPWLPPIVRGTTLILAPGAAHPTKRWPYFRELAASWDGPVRAIGGPGDERDVEPLGGTCETSFDRTIAALNGGAVMVAGDTGLMHLAVAVGLPVVALYGPTTSVDGFFDYPPHLAQAAEVPLSCRPCSRFGGAICPVGDHACMRLLTVEIVLAKARLQAALS